MWICTVAIGRYVLLRTGCVLVGIALAGCLPGQVPSVQADLLARDLIDRGSIQLERGYVEQAYALFEMAFEVSPIPEALDGLGCVELYRNNLDAARAWFELALAVDDLYFPAVGHLAMVAEMEGKLQVAQHLYRRALTEQVGDGRLRNNYAVFLWEAYRSDPKVANEVRTELLRAASFSESPIIIDNIEKLKELHEK